MSDIVERLRQASDSDAPLSIGEHWNLEDEAADEIERLRAENATLREALKRSQQATPKKGEM